MIPQGLQRPGVIMGLIVSGEVCLDRVLADAVFSLQKLRTPRLQSGGPAGDEIMAQGGFWVWVYSWDTGAGMGT